MLPMIIEVHRSYSLLFAAKDGADVNRLRKLAKIRVISQPCLHTLI